MINAQEIFDSYSNGIYSRTKPLGRKFRTFSTYSDEIPLGLYHLCFLTILQTTPSIARTKTTHQHTGIVSIRVSNHRPLISLLRKRPRSRRPPISNVRYLRMFEWNFNSQVSRDLHRNARPKINEASILRYRQ